MQMDAQRAYTELLRRHRNMIWRMCWLRSGGDYERCRDLVQEVSIALWLHFKELIPDATHGEKRAWVYWLTRTTINHKLRKPSVETMLLTSEQTDSLTDEASLCDRENIEDIMASLSPDEQHMVRLRMEGYKADEIASIMGLKRDAVYQRMHRAVVKMRQVLLILFLVLVLSTLAVAVVPSWRKTVIEKVHQKEDKGALRGEMPSTKPQDVVKGSQPEDILQEETSCTPVRVERLPDADAKALISCINGECDTLPAGLEAMLPEPIIVVSMRQLIVTGIYGERVSVYVQGGTLVSSQVCNGICVVGFLRDGVSYRIQVGRRPPIILDM